MSQIVCVAVSERLCHVLICVECEDVKMIEQYSNN